MPRAKSSLHPHDLAKTEMTTDQLSPDQMVDALSSLAPLLRVKPVLDTLCRFGQQWASPHAPERDGWVPFHLITRGACRIDLPDGSSEVLAAGDIAMLPHGGAHVMRGATTPATMTSVPHLRRSTTGAIEVKTNIELDPDPGPDLKSGAELVCGRLQFELAQQNLVLATLPSIIVLRAAVATEMSRLQQMLQAIREELTLAKPGAAAIATDLASALMVMVLRLHLTQQQTSRGLLGLLGHKQAARVVVAMIDQPDRAWSLDELAGLAGASRATLVRLFQKTAGLAPLEFLTDLRLNLARNKLAAGSHSIAEIAVAVGYQSESAFSRAFSRHFSMPPSAVRQPGNALAESAP
jgi:AraC family transcriptional activator of mtrCDE